MLLLPNGCTCSTPVVSPKNWKTTALKKKWRIQYYFRDPNFARQYPNGKLIAIRGMNHFTDLKERRIVTERLLNDELNNLRAGFNPILNQLIQDKEAADIEEYTPFMRAIHTAFEKLKLSKDSMASIKSAIRYIEQAAEACGFTNMPVSQMRRKHVIRLLDKCEAVKSQWSAHTYNHYRAYLMQLFKVMVRMEAIENNPVDADLPKADIEVNLRELLTPDERARIDAHFSNDKYFHRFIHIFFHSGARPVELTRLKRPDVNLEELYYKIKVRKRKKIIEEKRAIKHVALPFWREVMAEAKEQDYLFGKLLKPSEKQCPRDYITKKWQKEVKKGLGINKDLYSLKHLNLDETAAILTAEAAAWQAGHRSADITVKHYLVGEAERQRKILSKVANKFA